MPLIILAAVVGMTIVKSIHTKEAANQINREANRGCI